MDLEGAKKHTSSVVLTLGEDPVGKRHRIIGIGNRRWMV